ncbi:hypothetical protein KPB2_5346 [Klebsiella pneumoniae Kb677]|nr:hypothetical protein KPB2_5346 [Klebsiella pneumoniae Kb677]
MSTPPPTNGRPYEEELSHKDALSSGRPDVEPGFHPSTPSSPLRSLILNIRRCVEARFVVTTPRLPNIVVTLGLGLPPLLLDEARNKRAVFRSDAVTPITKVLKVSTDASSDAFPPPFYNTLGTKLPTRHTTQRTGIRLMSPQVTYGRLTRKLRAGSAMFSTL